MTWSLLFAMLACSGDDPSTVEEPLNTVRSGCDPLDPSKCAFPFPSSYHLAADSATETGFRVAYGPEALPITGEGLPMAPTYWNEKDGYSINSTLMFFFEDASDDGLTDAFSLEQFDAPDAKTVLVDVTTGTPVPHWAELDSTAGEDAQRVTLIRPAVPLEYDHHYAVGVRGMVTHSGTPIPPSPGFLSLRDSQFSGEIDIEDRRERFDATVFPALAAQGFARDDLQLAWDFHTISRESSIGRMVWMKDDALERVGPMGPAYTIVEQIDEDCTDPDQTIGRTLELEVSAPLYTEVDGPDTFLTRDEAGAPFYNGDTTFGVVVRIPCSVLTDPRPARVVQYGHGLLGDRGEAYAGWLGQFAHDSGYVVVAANWTGMSAQDIIPILGMMSLDPGRFALIPERSMQGMVQQLLVMPLVNGALKDDPALRVDGVSLIDPTRASYYGNSQGGIMGAPLMSLSNTLQEGVLGVSGVNYGLLLTRSSDFDLYSTIFQQTYEDDRDIALVVQGLAQQVWDESEGAGYLHTLTRDPLPGMQPNQVLIHNAIGDNQVTTLAGHIQARAYDAVLVGPATRPVWGLEETTTEHVGSALVEWHYADVPDEPVGNVPPAGPDPHECPRREPQGQEQVRIFFEEGRIVPACDGVCSSTVAEVCP